MSYYLTLFTVLFILASSNAMEEEGFTSYPDIPHEDQISGSFPIFEHVGFGFYTKSFAGNPIQENAEFSVENEYFSDLKSIEYDDGTCEFVRNEGSSLEKSNYAQEIWKENAEFGAPYLVNSNDVKNIPYRFLGNLLIEFPHSKTKENKPTWCIGSGVLIGPNHVLTAGHNVYDHERGGWAQGIVFTPAQHGDKKPFGDAKGTTFKTFKKWVENDKYTDYDIALVILDKRIGDQAGWIGLLGTMDSEGLKQKILSLEPKIAGYPLKYAALHGKNSEYKIGKAEIYEHAGKIKEINDRRLFYTISTWEGHSGSPIIASIQGFEEEHYYVLGIHTHGNKKANEGTRLTLKNLELIKKEGEKFTLPKSFHESNSSSEILFISNIPEDIKQLYLNSTKLSIIEGMDKPIKNEYIEKINSGLYSVLQLVDSEQAAEVLKNFCGNVTNIYNGKNGWIISEIVSKLSIISYEKRLEVVSNVIKERDSPLAKNQYQKESDILKILKKNL